MKSILSRRLTLGMNKEHILLGCVTFGATANQNAKLPTFLFPATDSGLGLPLTGPAGFCAVVGIEDFSFIHGHHTAMSRQWEEPMLPMSMRSLSLCPEIGAWLSCFFFSFAVSLADFASFAALSSFTFSLAVV